MWFWLALGSAVFAALTSILAKIGIEGVGSNLATAIRTMVVVVMAWGVDGISDIFPQSEVLRRLEKMCVCLYISRDKHIDMFPRTCAVEKIAFLRSKMP